MSNFARRSFRHIALGALALVMGCGSPRLDCTSDQTISASAKRMGDALGEERRKELTRAMMILTLPALMKASMASMGKDAPKLSKAEVFRPFDGMTADEIIEKAKARAAKH